MDLPDASAQPDDVELQVAVEGESFHIENDLIDSSTNQLGSRVHPQSTAREDDNAFLKAVADGAFHCIKYGVFKGQPACHICIDVSIDVGSGREIRNLRAEMAVGSKRSRDDKITKRPDAVVFPMITDDFGPKALHGPVTEETRRTTNYLSLEVGSTIGNLTTPSRESESQWVQKYRWSLHGIRRKSGFDRRYRVVIWTLSGSKLIQESIPHRIRLNLVVEHDNEPFDLVFRHVGQVREGTKFLDFVRMKRQHMFQFLPPHDSSDDIPEEQLERCLRDGNGNLVN